MKNGLCPACEIRPRRAISEVCAACAGHRYYWLAKVKREGPRVIGEYQQRLARWQHRMVYWSAEAPVGFRREAHKLKRYV